MAETVLGVRANKAIVRKTLKCVLYEFGCVNLVKRTVDTAAVDIVVGGYTAAELRARRRALGDAIVLGTCERHYKFVAPLSTVFSSGNLVPLDGDGGDDGDEKGDEQ